MAATSSRPSSRRADKTKHRCFAVCSPGIEQITADELAAIGARVHRLARGGVAFEATNRQLYASNLWLRTATRVVVRLDTFRAAVWDDLYAGIAGIDWSPWISPGSKVSLRVTSHGSRLYHTDAILERVAATLDALGMEVVERSGESDEGAPGSQLLVVRIAHDDVTVSVDASGAGLHRRGWRIDIAKAPLRPTLAAAMLLGAGWDGTAPLVDPFGGSGTIAIEAARLARDLPPAIDRRFAFEQWPSFERGTWASVAGEAASRARAESGVGISTSDRDAGAVRAATANAERAGVTADVEITKAALSDVTLPPGPGWVITNPPYGARLDKTGDLRDLYARLGQVVKAGGRDWRAGVLVADTKLAAQAKLRFQECFATSNGGLPVQFLISAPLSGEAGAALPG